MSKSINIAKTGGISLAVLMASFLAVNGASAHFGGGSEEERAERITEISERFDLDETEVETYFEEKQAEREAEREEKQAEHVASLIESGVLTQEQADELSAMRDASMEEMDALRDSGAEHEEIKAAMEDSRAEIEAWADSEGIDLDEVRPQGEGRGHRGHMRG